MPKTVDDEYCGTNGATVCWNPVTKKYYAAFAGNSMYPLAVFDAGGKLLSNTDLTTMQDVRGLWYNPVTKKICGNTYNDAGWFTYTLDAKGIPTDAIITASGMNQPDENSVGAFDPVSKQVYFLDKGKLVFYSTAKPAPGNTLPIHFGRPKILGPADDENPDNENTNYNQTTAVYAGNNQTALLNPMQYKIEVYDNKEGYLQQVYIIPEEDAPMPNRSFNFAYANNTWWLFDIDNRTWVGYR